jgi:hypothetical protein
MNDKPRSLEGEVALPGWLVSYFGLSPAAETDAANTTRSEAKEAEAEEVGGSEGTGYPSGKSWYRPIPVSSLRGILPPDRGVRRSLPLQQRGTPRFTLRPQKLGL